MKYSPVDVGLLVLRLIFGFRLIYGSADNVFSWNQMQEFEEFLEINGFPFPLISALMSVYAQFMGGILWIIGYKTKWVSLIMIFNFLVAIIGFHLIIGDSYLNTAPAIHLLAIALILFLNGAGRYSLDQQTLKQ